MRLSTSAPLASMPNQCKPSGWGDPALSHSRSLGENRMIVDVDAYSDLPALASSRYCAYTTTGGGDNVKGTLAPRTCDRRQNDDADEDHGTDSARA